MKKRVLAILMAFAIVFSGFQPLAANAQEQVVWCLDTHLMWFHLGNEHFSQSGLPAGSVTVMYLDDTRGLHVTGISGDHQGVDMRFRPVANHMRDGDRVVLTGRVIDPADDAQILLRRQPGNAIIGEFDVPSDGRFILAHTLTEEDDFLDSIRVSVAGASEFYLYSFQVSRDASAPNWDLTLPSLADIYRSHFMMGNIWSCNLQMADPSTVDKFLHHYNTITASNWHKPSFLISNTPNDWNFDFHAADRIVDWAEESGVAMVWHTLIWHAQSRAWLSNVPGTIEPLTRAEAIENMHTFISTVAGRYSGRIHSWDVVNEAITPMGSWAANPDWRFHIRRTGNGLDPERAYLTRWYDAFANGADIEAGECGTDYIFYAFRFARIYDPYAILYYNDYNEHVPVKRDAIADMIESINERWRSDPLYDGRLLIEGMGMQSHHSVRGWMTNPNYVRQAIERYVQTGVRLSMTELNMYIAGDGIDNSMEGLPNHFDEQARRYTSIFLIYMEFSDYIERVTSFIWVDFPLPGWTNRLDHPALFDIQRQAKPAFHAVAELPGFIGNPGTQLLASNISLPEIVTEELPAAQAGERFSTQFTAVQNTVAPMTWHIRDGELPEGLRLVSTTGVILGQPEEEGLFSFTIAVENALGSHERRYHLAVGDTATAEKATLAPEPVGAPEYHVTLAATDIFPDEAEGASEEPTPEPTPTAAAGANATDAPVPEETDDAGVNWVIIVVVAGVAVVVIAVVVVFVVKKK